LGYAQVRAPFAGVVTARMADPGAMGAPGAPILQIDQAGPLQLEASVDESAIASVHAGMKVQVRLDNSALPIVTGTVARIVPAADPGSHAFLVKIDLPAEAQLRAGIYATAEFPSGTHQAILAPRSAIVLRGSLHCAYVLDANGVAQLRYLTLGQPQGDAVEVLSGLSAGERLVDAPADRELAGKRIVGISTEVRP
ncbi:MAG: efflux RND transporter periplasmic adaptor subunit, partial [Terracidiphilus sp.]